MFFNDNELYKPTDPQLRKVFSPSTLAHWRCQQRGPGFIRVGARILYPGSSLNSWLKGRTVKTGEQ